MKKSELFFSAISVPIDYLFLVLAGIMSYLVRYHPVIAQIRPVTFHLSINNYLMWVMLLAPMGIVIFALSGLYAMKSNRVNVDEFIKITVSCSATIALLVGIMFFSRYLFDSRFIILMYWVLSIFFVLFGRVVLRAVQRFLYKYQIGVHRVVVIGQNSIGNDLVHTFNSQMHLGYHVTACFSDFSEQVRGKLEKMAEDDTFDEVILADPNMERAKIMALLDLLNYHHLDFKYIADLLGTKISNIAITNYDSIPVVEVVNTPLDGWGRIIKRIFDIFLSFIFIVLLLPIILLTAVAVKLDTPGPIFFTYKRVGQKRKIFTFIKFRSMLKDAHKYRFDKNFLEKNRNLRWGTPMMKFQNDPRITKVGRIIRRWSIDELPQLFLVIMGKMSLVGPRPHEIEEVSKYDKYQLRVLSIKPGITGLSQVSGRSDLSFDQESKLDTFYIENWSLLLDFYILFKTPIAVIKKRNTL